MTCIACFVTCFSLCAGSALARVATLDPAGQVAQATFPEGAKVAFVNLQVVFDQSALGKETFARLRSFDAENGAQLQSKVSELQDLQNRLESQRSLLPPDALSAPTREVEFKARQLQFDRENVQIRPGLDLSGEVIRALDAAR